MNHEPDHDDWSPDHLPPPRLSPRSGLLVWAGVLAIFCVLLLPGAPARPRGAAELLGEPLALEPIDLADLDLRAVPAASKLNREEDVSAEPAVPVEAFVQVGRPAPPELPPLPPPAAPAPPPALLVLSMPEPLPVAEPVPAQPDQAWPDSPEPDAPEQPTPMDSHPEEDTMTKPLTVQIFFTAWFLAVPALQADEKPATPPAGETADRLNKLERRVGDLEEGMKALKNLPDQLDARDKIIGDTLSKLREDIKNLQVPPRIQKDLPDTALPGNGQLALVNTWDSPVLIVVDGTDYLLRPNQTRTITKRPGRFNYEVRRVDGRLIQAARDSELRTGGRPHMIEIYPTQ